MLTVAIIIFVVLVMGALFAYAPPLLRRPRRIRRRTYTEAERKDQLKQALAAKRKLDLDAKVDWCNDYFRLAGEEWTGLPRLSQRQVHEQLLADDLMEMIRLEKVRLQSNTGMLCQHKWSYNLGTGVRQMHCSSCGAKG